MTIALLFILALLLYFLGHERRRKALTLDAVRSKSGARLPRLKTWCGFCRIISHTQGHDDGRHLTCWRCGARFYDMQPRTEPDANLSRLGIQLRTGRTVREMSG